MEKFIIDRSFGQAVWVNVNNGIVVDCYNESERFNNKMNELYAGKSISFLKVEFEKRMKPSYVDVRPESTYSINQNICTVQNQIGGCTSSINQYGTSPERKKELEKARELLFEKKEVLIKKLKFEYERLKDVHGYDFPLKSLVS